MTLYIYTLMKGCSDRKGPYTVRKHAIGSEGRVDSEDWVWDCETLDDARKIIPVGLFCFSRDERDDPVIVESWL
jgi:hypothetical protein